MLARAMPTVVAGIGLGAVAAALLAAACQPLITDDTWLHLALGRAYAAEGPWLESDPLLARPLGPPTPAAWLFDVIVYGVERATGFAGLRVLHVGLVAALLTVAWVAFRRAGASVALACLACAAFATLSAYRLIQLRPHLLSMLAAILLYQLVIARTSRPSAGRIVAAIGLIGVWANVHAGFLLGPVLLAAAFGSLLVTMLLRGPGALDRDRARLIALAATGGLGLIATFFNPAGLEPHLAWFVSGTDTPSLGRVADEWTAFDPFRWPAPGIPPTGFTWLLQWGLLLITPCIAIGVAASALHPARTSGESPGTFAQVDPPLVGIALVSIALPFVAVRFLWLGFFPLLLIVSTIRYATGSEPRARANVRLGAAVATGLVAVGFFRFGPWATIAATLPSSLAGYRPAYPAGKYHARLAWMAQDAGLRGTAFAEYHIAGFAAVHLAPDVRMLVNGTLNVPADVMAANLPLRERRGERPGERFTELLDRHGIDLYFGIRLPAERRTAAPFFHTTAHLERTPGWIPIFRNIAGAVYLRDAPRNRDNLERVALWYRARSVPFDPAVGFDVERVAREAPGFAVAQGLLPIDFERLTRTAYRGAAAQRAGARATLASVYAALGLYERVVELDRTRLAEAPDAIRARRRLVWALLRLGRDEEALEAAEPLARQPEQDALSHQIARAARTAASLDDEQRRASLVARLPVFDALDVAGLTSRITLPAPRPPPR